jgi:hypothetical protein
MGQKNIVSFEEKLIRYIASKLLQKNFFLKKHRLPSDKELANLINVVIEKVKQKYKQFSLVRRNSPHGLLTPLIKNIIDEI